MSETVCASGVDLLMDYLEGLLPPATVASVDAHVAGCERCQAFIGSYSATPRIFRNATDVTLPASLSSSLLQWLRQHRTDPGRI